jgi:KDO2-lipid IV(A) lauroyltransferase
VVGREVYDPKLDKLLVENRERVGLEYISSTDDVRRIISSLHQGRAVGILADQDSTRVKGVFVDFFGRKAKTPIGPALLYLKYGSPIIPLVILRSGKYNYRIIIKKPLAFEPTGEREKDLIKITQLYTGELEVIIRENPSQWVWMHKRWKSRSV